MNRLYPFQADALVTHQVRQVRGDDADHLTASLASGVRQCAHEPDPGTAVDDAEAPLRQRPAEALRCQSVGRIATYAGAAHHADAVVLPSDCFYVVHGAWRHKVKYKLLKKQIKVIWKHKSSNPRHG